MLLGAQIHHSRLSGNDELDRAKCTRVREVAVTTSIGDNKLNLVPVRSTRSLRRQCAQRVDLILFIDIDSQAARTALRSGRSVSSIAGPVWSKYWNVVMGKVL